MNDLIWQNNCPAPSPLRNWAQADSLTQTLSELADFSVKLKSFGKTSDFPYFADFRPPETMFGRSVILCLNDVPVVHAQSVCAMNSVWREILDCGRTPLGKILFSGSLNGLIRNEIQFAQPENYLLARRSWFEWQGERLYLVECFLQEIEKFIINVNSIK